jgi:hypothetical protein
MKINNTLQVDITNNNNNIINNIQLMPNKPYNDYEKQLEMASKSEKIKIMERFIDNSKPLTSRIKRAVSIKLQKLESKSKSNSTNKLQKIDPSNNKDKIDEENPNPRIMKKTSFKKRTNSHDHNSS